MKSSTKYLPRVREPWVVPRLRQQFVVWLAACAWLGCGETVVGQALRPGDAEDYAPGELLIKFRATATGAQLSDAWQGAELGLIQSIKFKDARHPGITHVSTRMSVPQALRRLARHPAIEYAEPNYRIYPAVIPNDPLFSQLWGLHNTGGSGSTVDADIDAPEAWNVTAGSSSVLVGVIDTGIDISHPDLAPNIWTNPDEIPGDGIDNDGNGYVDDLNGWDFWNGDNSVYDSVDGDFHGTHVAGTLGAVGNNGMGIAGVSWRAKILPLKFIGPEVGYFSGAINAVNYAAAKGVKVLNGSFGRYSTGPGDVAQGLKDAIQAAGILFVAAAGNDGNNNDTTPFYPASYDLDLVLSVAATDRRDRLASFSSYGAISVDLGAPGVGILSAMPGNRYQVLAGTSMAAPHVAGAASLVYSQFPHLSATQVKNQILNSVDSISALSGKTVTGGRLNAASALALMDQVPEVAITEPVDGAVVAGTWMVTAIASDDQGVSQVRFYLDGTLLLGTDFEAPYELVWDTTSFGEGVHTLAAVATDTSNQTSSHTINVLVDNFNDAPIEVFADSFEAGLVGWVQDSQNDWFASAQRATDGVRSAGVDGAASDAQLSSPLIALQGRTGATISFDWLIASTLDKGEYLACDVSLNGGSTWSEATRLRGNVDAENVWSPVTIEVSSAPAGTLRLRFRGKMSATDEYAHVDDVRVVAH